LTIVREQDNVKIEWHNPKIGKNVTLNLSERLGASPCFAFDEAKKQLAIITNGVYLNWIDY
jgi:hypothetical protein